MMATWMQIVILDSVRAVIKHQSIYKPKRNKKYLNWDKQEQNALAMAWGNGTAPLATRLALSHPQFRTSELLILSYWNSLPQEWRTYLC